MGQGLSLVSGFTSVQSPRLGKTMDSIWPWTQGLTRKSEPGTGEPERSYHQGCWTSPALLLVRAVVLPALTSVCPENTSSSLSVQLSWPLLCKAFLYF